MALAGVAGAVPARFLALLGGSASTRYYTGLAPWQGVSPEGEVGPFSAEMGGSNRGEQVMVGVLRRPAGLFLLAAGCLFAGGASAQAMFSLFVATKDEIAARMVALADPKSGETVIDLGSGDGRLVIRSAKDRPGVRGVGVDIDAKLVGDATANSDAEGVSDRVRFMQQNVFDADLSKVDVIYMWLFPELMRLLRPKILREARPGTRVVSQMFDMGDWQSDRSDEQQDTVRLWVVPAKVQGNWQWTLTLPNGRRASYAAVVEQQFQKSDAAVRVGKERRATRMFVLRGDEVTFSLTIPLPGLPNQDHEFTGKVRGNVITGTVKLRRDYDADTNSYKFIELPWRAVRSTQTSYFAPTGLPTPTVLP
ncbi:MAG: methyltransferase domain-containing protein [Betaproteobacteria bacterium]|nr:methyltransferase domain-containing protein [Betaproteobacteria bacterium]